MEEGGTVFEALVISFLASVLLVLGISVFMESERLARETVMRYELRNIRTAIILYNVMKKTYPEDLSVMIDEQYAFPHEQDGVIKRKYLEPSSTDSEGYPLDPFGNPFSYDRHTGMIRSSTNGYESW